MPKLAFAPSAQQDLTDIFDYIARDKPIAAAKWIDSIEKKFELIASTPEFGKNRPEHGVDIRSSVVGRYVIFYRAVDDGIEVVRVIPGDRDVRFLWGLRCEAYSRIRERAGRPADRRTLFEELQDSPPPSDERLDASEYVAVLSEAVSRRNGWKAILEHCSV